MANTYNNKYGVGAYCNDDTYTYLQNNLDNPAWLGSQWFECGKPTLSPAIKQYNGNDGTYQWFWNPTTESFDSSYQQNDYTIDIDEVYDSVDANGYDIYW